MTLPTGSYSQEELSWFRAIFDDYYESIRSFAYYKTGSVDLADDVVQEVFLKLWNIRSSVRNDTVKTLLYTIATNLIKNHFKHQRVVYNFQVSKSTQDEAESADANVRMDDMNRQLQDALASIPDAAREVFLMNRIDGFTYSEIAQRLNLSVKTVEKRMSEAIRLLRNKFGYKL
ncbi:MAG TPA: RNA polymerase sigma-70 factor [Tenuifilaceae bacterium]|jgi:RNA polymerase sigma-70 factor (ECF subfamily)|nr:RNA polymerase sigma-70 factor [Bacteroidales bacterium]HNT41963.1 RNA polymerase sigma-70 factor [Tenuifilaceae bacterium]MBP8643687.1 RNA polymerase sigma-70 factor [Bacteroidales bacterium]NLI88468.1 RNA polymerase sigma-70 factor [Bacteroidales bacterium]HNY08302.1 RNA polymerase sigma-70 factor [Tenuifilaceae bacterium]